jgi:predicted RNA-binding Zn ribbon-like protein
MAFSSSAVLLRDFVNTYDVDCDADEFGAPSDLGAWLSERGLVPAGTRVGESDLAAAVALREGLRSAMLAHQESARSDERAGARDVDRVLAALPLRLSLDGPAVVPARGGARGGLAGIAAAVVACLTDGDWPRLKACPGCRWAFLDASKNRSRSWCSMRMCGNRAKTRAYRARRRG